MGEERVKRKPKELDEEERLLKGGEKSSPWWGLVLLVGKKTEERNEKKERRRERRMRREKNEEEEREEWGRRRNVEVKTKRGRKQREKKVKIYLLEGNEFWILNIANLCSFTILISGSYFEF